MMIVKLLSYPNDRNLVDGIKAIRAMTNCSLKEGMDIIRTVSSEIPVTLRVNNTSEVARSGITRFCEIGGVVEYINPPIPEFTKAIVVPYFVDQNLPSVPLNRLVNIPSDPAARDNVLTNLFSEVFDLDEEETENIEIDIHDSKFGDLEVEGNGLYLFIIFVRGE